MNGASILALSDQTVRRRVADIDSCRVNEDLDARGFALIDNILSPRECRKLASLYPDDVHFRSRVVMAQHGFGRGEYKYFAYPLPGVIFDLRTETTRIYRQSPTDGTRRWASTFAILTISPNF
jgi:hypothetical protein